MQENVIYVGVDVDDNSFHVTALIPETGEVIETKTKSNLKGLVNKLEDFKKKFPNHALKICYEATYIGFTLQRDLASKGYDCVVVAPSSIPRVHGNQVKTDRVDAGKLAQFLSAGILTFVSVPDKETESDRDLLRSRQFMLHQLAEVRTHIQSLLRRNGIHYKSETKNISHWTKHHLSWLDTKADEAVGSFKQNLKLLVQQMKWLNHSLSEYGKAVDELATTEKYKKQVSALVCYKGIKNIFAMVMITEIGNVKRFAHPRQLVSWMGMDVCEYSSGGKSHKFGITGHGNRYLRTAFVEANQRAIGGTRLSDDLKQRRKNIDPDLIHIADRCMARIRKKGMRLLHAGKHSNKVKVACAREMVGFVWESLNKVA
jgi:transposase